MSKRASTALTVHKPEKTEEPSAPAEKLPVPEDLIVPSALLLAAESSSEHKDDKRPYLQAVYIHSKDGVGRVVGTDGSRMFLASFPIALPVPSWLTEGLLLANDGLKTRIGMTGKGEDAKVRITYQAGMATATLSDMPRSMSFRLDRVDHVFPEYDRIIPAQAFQRLDDEGDSVGNEWEPVGINSVFLKHVGEVAKLLDAGLPKATTKLEKEARAKGMVVRAFNSARKSDKPVPLVFDFSTYPGAILVVMPHKLTTPAITAQTAALLAPAVRLSVAALRAHATRNMVWAAEAEKSGDTEKAAFLTAKAEQFNKRVAELLTRVPGVQMLEGPEPEPQPEPEPEPEPEAREEGEVDPDWAGEVEEDEAEEDPDERLIA